MFKAMVQNKKIIVTELSYHRVHRELFSPLDFQPDNFRLSWNSHWSKFCRHFRKLARNSKGSVHHIGLFFEKKFNFFRLVYSNYK